MKKKGILKKWRILLSAAVLAGGIGLGNIGVFAAPAETAPVASSPAQAEAQAKPKIAVGMIRGEVIDDHVIVLPTFTHVNQKAVLAADAAMLDQKVACSAIAKVLDTGDMVVGRSMDLAYSDRPAYVIRTAIPGRYKTVGISYNPYSGPTFEEAAEKGISEQDAVSAMAFSEDIFNEKGLYIEVDMRMDEPESTGIKPSTGTNPGAKYRMSWMALCRFLGERCATVDEAVALAKTLDVHNAKTDTFDWGGALLLADASGHFGVLELVDNKLVWVDGQRGHANFYVNDEYRDRTLFQCGKGRYDVLISGIDAVRTEDDMARLIYKVRFSQLLDPETSEFDPRSDFEEIDPAPYHEAGIHTTVDALAEENRDKMMEIMKMIGARERAKTPEQLKAEGTQWLSAFQTVANCNKKTLRVLFFEDPLSVHEFTVE